jgi:YfiH family protein
VSIVEGTLGRGARWAFADRTDGASLAPYDAGNLALHVGDDPDHVASNRARLAAAVGLPGEAIVGMAPVHGNGVAVVRERRHAPVPDVDALVTDTPGLALLTLAADCVPVLLADVEAGVVGVVHSGWRGVLVDVTGTTLGVMVDLGARADRMQAVVGPAICGSCYPVPQERYDEVIAVAPLAASTDALGRPSLDLRRAVVEGLRSRGVSVTVVGLCTYESATLYSFRRDPVTGRHGAVVALEADVA